MKCSQARRLFGAYWDDDATQAERECVEAHFAACAECRREYEEYSRALEWVATLPRVEARPDFTERVLARARRATAVPDRMREPGVRWVPATAAAALLVVVAGLLSPWLGIRPGTHLAGRTPAGTVVREPELVQPQLATARDEGAPARESGHSGRGSQLAGGPSFDADSLFDHSEDVEFILDPITLRRGRAAVSRVTKGSEGKPAVISF